MIFMNGHKVSQVICLNCHRRWLAARPVEVPLEDLECPDCSIVGSAIETGETCVAEVLIRKASNDKDNNERNRILNVVQETLKSSAFKEDADYIFELIKGKIEDNSEGNL